MHTDISLCMCLHTHMYGFLKHAHTGDTAVVFHPQTHRQKGRAFVLKGAQMERTNRGTVACQLFLIPSHCTGTLWSDPVPKVSLEITLKLK